MYDPTRAVGAGDQAARAGVPHDGETARHEFSGAPPLVVFESGRFSPT